MRRLADALALVVIASESRQESALARLVEARLRENPALEVERVGDNVVGRTNGFHGTRLLVAGHLDTVPGDASRARIEGDTLYGVGACDMKGSVSVMLELAGSSTPREVEVTWVFYAREEIAHAESGLLEIAELRPELLQADAAVLAEPTGGAVEAGCQGTLRVEIELGGVRAHTARPYTGRNAIHRLGALLVRVASFEPRSAVVEGVTYVEQLQAVAVSGGVANNVVPDVARCALNYRVAPDRSVEEAVTFLRLFLDGLLEPEDRFEVIDWAPSAPPSMGNERLASLVALSGRPLRGKVGWTDVASFFALGVPAANFGAGDPLLAHRSDECVTSEELNEFAQVLGGWLS